MLSMPLCAAVQGALVMVLWDDNKPNFGMGDKARHNSPRLVQFPKLEDEE